MAASRYMCVDPFTAERRGVEYRVERGDLLAANDRLVRDNPDAFVEADAPVAQLRRLLDGGDAAETVDVGPSVEDVGGGWFRLPDGRKVQGRDEALAALGEATQ